MYACIILASYAFRMILIKQLQTTAKTINVAFARGCTKIKQA